MKTHVFFDFDGTLVDSAPAILDCLSQVLHAHGLQACRNIDHSLIGPPLRHTLQTLCGRDDAELLDRLSDSFRDIYDAHACLGTPAYAGWPQVLEALHAQELILAIATNKRLVPTLKILEALGWRSYFAAVYASDSHPQRYCDKTGMIAAQLQDFGISAQAACYVGDTEQDGRAAEANALEFLPVAWGYGVFASESRPLASPQQLLCRLAGQGAAREAIAAMAVPGAEN